MDLTNFSLLYPDAETKQDYYAGKNKPDIDMYTLQELGMLEILDLKSSAQMLNSRVGRQSKMGSIMILIQNTVFPKKTLPKSKKKCVI